MKKLILLPVLMMFAFSSCKDNEAVISKLKSPVTIIGTDHKLYVAVKDSNGVVMTFSDCALQFALNSRNIGDTIK